MAYTASTFFDELCEIIADEVFIGSTRDDLVQELKTNTWWISAMQDQCDQLSKEDMLSFFRKLVTDRQQKVSKAQRHGMLFYLWFDEQACQLKFSLISDFHSELPFKSTINLIETPDSIIETFLRSNCHSGISWDELDILDTDEIPGDVPPIRPSLNVYMLHLSV